MKKLLNADPFMGNHDNKVEDELLTNVLPNVEYYLDHSIYFGESLEIYRDKEKTEALILERDYTFAVMDTIATEQSNKDCYRAVIFFAEFDKVYLFYHSYGDIVCADTFNDFLTTQESNKKEIETTKIFAKNLKTSFDEHEKNTKAHGAIESPEPASIALRTSNGTLKGANPKESNDLTTLETLESKLQSQKVQIDQEQRTARNELITRFQAFEPAIEKYEADPEGSLDGNAPDYETQLEKLLEQHVEKPQAFYNAIRNKNGSITVPVAKNENEAINKEQLEKYTDNKLVEYYKKSEVDEKLSKIPTSGGGQVYDFDIVTAYETNDTVFIGGKRKPVIRLCIQKENVTNNFYVNTKEIGIIEHIMKISGTVTGTNGYILSAENAVSCYVDNEILWFVFEKQGVKYNTALIIDFITE